MLAIILDMLSLAGLVAQPLPPSPPTKLMPVEAVKIDRDVVADALLNAAERPSEPRITRGRGNSITISGRLFYNDRRDDGLHGVRRDPAGKPTLECDPNGILVQRGPNGQCSVNWAGA